MNLQEKDIKSVLYQLNERTKELNCVYEIDTILRHFDSEVDETINRLIEVIPNGFQFTDICKIKFIYKVIILQSHQIFPLFSFTKFINNYYVKNVHVHVSDVHFDK